LTKVFFDFAILIIHNRGKGGSIEHTRVSLVVAYQCRITECYQLDRAHGVVCQVPIYMPHAHTFFA